MLSTVSPDSRDGPIIYREPHGGLKAAPSPAQDDHFPLNNKQRFSQTDPLHCEKKADGKNC